MTVAIARQGIMLMLKLCLKDRTGHPAGPKLIRYLRQTPRSEYSWNLWIFVGICKYLQINLRIKFEICLNIRGNSPIFVIIWKNSRHLWIFAGIRKIRENSKNSREFEKFVRIRKIRENSKNSWEFEYIRTIFVRIFANLFAPFVVIREKFVDIWKNSHIRDLK